MTEFKFYPQSVVWEITFACNMRCVHCGTAAGKQRPQELTTEEGLNLIDELAALGCHNITLSGGEPLMREDWHILAKRIKERGIQAYLITNGYAVNEKTVEMLAQLNMNQVGISFDGTEKTHNFIRQRDDSYRRVLRSMGMLKASNVPFCGVSQISNLNVNELDQMRQILIDAGCKLWRIQMTTVTGRMKGMADMILSLENYPKMIDKIIEFKHSNGIRVDVGENIGYYGCGGMELWDELPYMGCFAGTRVAGIESDGTIKGCLSMPEDFVEGNIREKSFTEIWNNPDGFAYNRKFTKDTASGACHDCRYLPLCRGGCTTTSFSQTGCRADNPYCIHQMELAKGITPPPDHEVVAKLLEPFNESDQTETKAG
jgi:radical SAM protein with 4Fe4S-binding SPASM domain